MYDFHKVLTKEQTNRILSKGRKSENFHWMNTINRKLLLEALDQHETTVTLVGLAWSKFGITKLGSGNIYVKPIGRGAPFTPTAEFNINRLRGSVS